MLWRRKKLCIDEEKHDLNADLGGRGGGGGGGSNTDAESK